MSTLEHFGPWNLTVGAAVMVILACVVPVEATKGIFDQISILAAMLVIAIFAGRLAR